MSLDQKIEDFRDELRRGLSKIVREELEKRME
jgi:uncharacterized protein YheU (UPF0270 family)